jgi:hypothetical protein
MSGFCRWIFLLILFVFAMDLSSCLPGARRISADVEKRAGFIKAEGAKLFLDGQEWREMGLNKHDLFLQYLFAERNSGDKETARGIIRELAGHNFRVLRLIISPFSPADFFTFFFDDEPRIQEAKRAWFFAALDELLDDCDDAGIKLAAVLVWNMENLADLGRHSLFEGVTNPQSLGYRRFEEFVAAVVERYKDRPTIAIWEIGSEYNLFADLQNPEGVLSGGPEGDAEHPGPLVRDARNNFNSGELRDFFYRVFSKIRTIDKNHLLTTGNSEPRPAAMHLFRAAVLGKEPDWTDDTLQEQEEYVRMTHLDADVISIHWYLDNVDLGRYQELAWEMNKPILISEVGPSFKWVGKTLIGGDYTLPQALENLKPKLARIVEEKIPLVFLWRYSEKEGPFQLFYGKTDEALLAIEEAGNLLRK